MAPNIVLRKGTYYVRVQVPADVQSVLGKREFWESLKTSNFHDAKKAAPPIIAKFKREIAAARNSAYGGRGQAARNALALWAVKEAQRPTPSDGEINSDWAAVQRVDALQRAWQDPEGWRAIEGFDRTLAAILTRNGFPASEHDPILADVRQEAALIFLYAAQSAERGRITNAFLKGARVAAKADLDAVATTPSKPVSDLPAPSLTITSLYAKWVAALNPVEKERGRLDHSLRRLIEFVGDIPANYLSKEQVADFMSWVARFPGRKRSAALNALPIRVLVERFEEINAELIKAGHQPTPTLTVSTVEEWFAGFKRMFAYGVDLDLIEKNPFDRIKSLVVKGAPALKRRAYTDAEIIKIFSAPLFTGFDPDRSTRFREIPGETVKKDVRYWLPILSLFHGGRLTELAAMPLSDFKQTSSGTWFFDLTDRPLKGARRVKTESGKREIPLHPHMAKIGFLEYVVALRAAGEVWLFPDLDHDSRHGAGHEFSKWWGEWMDNLGLSDPQITHHSWRHSWKRRARASSVKEEMHDVISGHKGIASVGREYGEGADIEDLARDMALIEFPAFPALP